MGRRRPDRRPGDPRGAAPRRAATCSPRCCWRRACRCCSPATRSATARAATTTPIARTTRSAGSTGRGARSAGRRPHRPRRAAHRACAAPSRSCRGGAGWMGRRADGNYDVKWLTPQGRRNDRGGLGLRRGAFPLLRAGADRATAVRRCSSCSTRPREAIEYVLPEWPGCSRVVLPAGHGRGRERQAGMRRLTSGRSAWRRARSVSVFAGCVMTAQCRFGPRLDDRRGDVPAVGAGGATRSSSCTTRRDPMRRDGDGWFDAHACRRRAPARATLPHRRRASRSPIRPRASSPTTCTAPSEVIDHAYDWQATDWRGRPWDEAVILELHVGTFTPAGHVPRRDRAARPPGRRPASPRSS